MSNTLFFAMDPTKGIANLTSITRADIRHDTYELVDKAYELTAAKGDIEWELYRRFWNSLVKANAYRTVKKHLVLKVESLKTVRLKDCTGVVQPMSLAISVSKEDLEILRRAVACYRQDMSNGRQEIFQWKVNSYFQALMCTVGEFDG
ncbi:hypothetical protein M413DRAFT_11161 [Hebeloma cylindrosporum]|uniref:Uncharacterized protein n=1 Tax=Hebeloma cylindrosporum TaxID=76867 RepID=A0A0C3CB42_HEBCY|nr:hypothetical protein M413DRAFT_11161 [Hebeloma cylindrosporum h7]